MTIYTGPVFEMAAQQFAAIADHLAIPEDERPRLLYPKRAVVVSCPIHRDDGSTAVFQGYRVQHHLTLGPTKGGTRFAASLQHMKDQAGVRFATFMGGEPLLQLDPAAIAALKAESFEIAGETNGTLPAPDGIDWICVSPKAQTALAQTRGQELKLVYPQVGVDPARFEGLDFERFWLQPMDGPARDANTKLAVAYCLSHPRWRLSLQTHKYIGIA